MYTIRPRSMSDICVGPATEMANSPYRDEFTAVASLPPKLGADAVAH